MPKIAIRPNVYMHSRERLPPFSLTCARSKCYAMQPLLANDSLIINALSYAGSSEKCRCLFRGCRVACPHTATDEGRVLGCSVQWSFSLALSLIRRLDSGSVAIRNQTRDHTSCITVPKCYFGPLGTAIIFLIHADRSPDGVSTVLPSVQQHGKTLQVNCIGINLAGKCIGSWRKVLV